MDWCYISANKQEKIVAILSSDKSEQEKADEILEIISLDQWQSIYKCMDIEFKQNKLMRKIGINYKYFKANGVFKKYKNPYKCDFDEIEKRLDILNEIYKIINTDLTDERKLRSLLNYYKTYNEFKINYSLLLKFGKNDERLSKGKEALDSFSSIDSEILRLFNNEGLYNNVLYQKEVEEVLEENLYFDNYLYAEWVIKNYIDYDRNYLKYEYLNKIGITEETFDYCVEIIRFLNPILYNELQEVTKKSNDRRMFNLDKTYLNLEFGILNGYLQDGTPFNLLEFYKRVPFKNSGKDFMNKTFDFLQRIYGPSSSTYKIIASYLYKNNIRTISYVSKEKILKTKYIVNGVQIDEKIVNDVFDCLDAYNYPKISTVYRIVLNKYLNDEIDMVEVKERLLELNNSKSNNELNNPYVLVKKK